MARQLVYEFARGGRVRATLLEDRAPRTCAAIQAVLPHEAEVLHARWAGREVFLPLPLPAKPPMEHQVNRVSAGDIIYAREWEGVYDNTGFETMGQAVDSSAAGRELERVSRAEGTPGAGCRNSTPSRGPAEAPLRGAGSDS